ncbi:YceI family protein [Paraglaciecola sp. MB-3u-78]|jgi:polyisoprenoid-binding protein YceI|uniref:YceI family protein n=1 Tax=Paraglaciecola sp. MB-3u-78 TaxID=2058332 RepID=UPI000C327D22|nr:YceI family protein [Paraglaciecola sp. MB-3u-78]PKG97942.1 YceI family protein [Paraglaciecola sp. MB-3u-78]
MKSFLLSTIFISIFLFSATANAHWMLVEDESSLSFVSTKNQHISEIQQFKSIKGEFSPEGEFQLEIDLASIDSGIEIRDTRMREKLFLVDKFPTANLTAQLPDSVLTLAKGNSISVTLPVELNVMGISKTISTTVQVTRKADNGIVATSTQPILISAADFGLTSGIEILQKLAGLSGIGLTVPVNFNLVFVAH